MMHTNERGSTLIISMLMMLVMLGLAASMTFNAQSQANMASGAKLQQFYETAALNAFNQTRAVLPDYWTDVDPLGDQEEDYRWRFGDLLDQAAHKTNTDHGNFPENDLLDYYLEMNSGMLELSYKVWVSNNPDDPGVLLQGMDIDPDPSDEILLTENWDMDGKIVLKVEVFSPSDPDNPVATQSALLGPVGGEYAYIHKDAVLEGDASDVGGQGTGTAGSASGITIAALDAE